ncbi:MAG: NUDIX domain-containing protein [Chloroflexi bacterium]|nr:NUDIX domain-containing protein [Chloroflexota bacterium]
MGYALFRRADEGYWQPIAGGGEDDETPEEAARREAMEEAHLPPDGAYAALQTMTYVPTTYFKAQDSWGDQIVVIPLHYFAVHAGSQELVLSHEHSECRWVSFEAARDLLRWDSDRTALWELDQRLRRKLLR